MSQITAHILDTSKGVAVSKVRLTLFNMQHGQWIEMAVSETDNDGRVKDLLRTTTPLTMGMYKLRFDTKDYFEKQQIPTFYPFVEIVVDITTEQHYHIPLLLSPFGYSTYRGT